MSAYNKFRGVHCGHHEHLLTTILKKNWGFQGFVLSDFTLGVRDGKSAVHGGMDIEMPFGLHMRPKKMLKMLKNGDISVDQVNESVSRIIRQKLLFLQPQHNQNPEKYTMKMVACQDHIDLALEAARKSIVLLQNKDQLLPLDRKTTKKIVIVGKLGNSPNIGDHGSSQVYPPYVITPLEGITKAAGQKVDVVYNDGNDLVAMQNMVKNADATIVIVGYTSKEEGEYVIIKGGDREKLTLTEKDETLIKNVSAANSNCIVVLEAGSAIITENWKEQVKSIIMAWYPGMEGGTALGEIIFGDVNPSGKLPISFPKSMDQLPFFDKNAKSIEYGYFHGYTLMEKDNHIPAFPFGFGLSYTTFEYSSLKLYQKSIKPHESLKLDVVVKNIGGCIGEEIIQLYVSFLKSSVIRPIKKLCAFKRIKLEAGEEKTVTMVLNSNELSYFNEKSNSWMIESGDHKILIGGSSITENLLTSNFEIVV
jgi:beta-glucosidase